MTAFRDRWTDFPGYILGITKEIWEDRGVSTLDRYYAPDMVMRTPMGISRGNRAVMASTMETIHEFPDRQLYGEDVIWSDHPEHGLLSSHRVVTTATHSGPGRFGVATGRRMTIRVIADCAVRGESIYDEWLVRDYGGLVRQLGIDPRDHAAATIAAEGGPERASRPFLPEDDVDGGYHGRGNEDDWGRRYADTLTRLMAGDFAHLNAEYDRAVQGQYPGATATLGREGSMAFWLGLRAAFPDAAFAIHHRIGMAGGVMPPRAAIRWSLDGTHDGWGAFGSPTGARVHVFGASHAEFGPWGLRRETALYDEIAIWKQILLARG